MKKEMKISNNDIITLRNLIMDRMNAKSFINLDL